MTTSENDSDQTIVINDLLSYCWCKFKLYSIKSMEQAINSFYMRDEISEALNTLQTALGLPIIDQKKKSNIGNDVEAILTLLESSSEQDLPIFVCKDINNVPKINDNVVKDGKKEFTSKSSSKGEFMQEHKKLKNELQDLFSSLCEMKKQYESVVGDDVDISNLEEKMEKFGIPKKKPLVKDLNYLQSLIDQEENDDPVEVFPTEGGEDDDIVQQRINLIANRKQRASLRVAKKQGQELKDLDEEDEPSEKPKIIHIDKNSSVKEENRFIIVDALYDESRKMSTSIYRCSHCPFRSTDKNAAMNHTCDEKVTPYLKQRRKSTARFLMVEHYLDEILGAYVLYKCSICDFCSNDEEIANNHSCQKEKTTRRQKSYECHSCGSSFKMRKELQKHIESHLGGGHRCPLCSTRLSLEQWLEHVRGCPGDGSTSLEDHYCEVCDVFYADKRTLSFHRAFHDPSRPFQCVECHFRFYTQKTVEDHYKSHVLHRNSRKCPFCEFRAFKAAKIVDHIRCHTGDRPYKCPKCDRSCTTYNALKVHLTSHVSQRDFSCDICGKKFKSQNKVSSHKKIHNMERPHKCPICGKGFKFGLQMALHHRMHLDIRKHACPLCPYKARTAAVLRGHLNTHTKSKPYKCTQCDFGANHKSYLNWHIRCYHPKQQPDWGNIM